MTQRDVNVYDVTAPGQKLMSRDCGDGDDVTTCHAVTQ